MKNTNAVTKKQNAPAPSNPMYSLSLGLISITYSCIYNRNNENIKHTVANSKSLA